MEEISLVTPNELSSVVSLVQAATAEMEKNGIHQWDEVYPAADHFLQDIRNSSLFALRINGRIAGIVALNEAQSPEYAEINWLEQNNRPLIVHRLCIHPEVQGRGLAKKLMQFTEAYARNNKYNSIRLDAFLNNPRALALYDELGYLRRGIVRFRKGPFYCFEKAIRAD